MDNIIKCFSILVASGNSHRCKQLREILHSELIVKEKNSSLTKIDLFKSDSDQSAKIGIELYKEVSPIFTDIPDKYFSVDKKHV